ncbi:MAG: hypothetical protein WAM94_09410 [Chromatiaceae bacterium]
MFSRAASAHDPRFRSGTRILTLGKRAPLSILYREIPPLTLRITAFPGATRPDMRHPAATQAVPES